MYKNGIVFRELAERPSATTYWLVSRNVVAGRLSEIKR